jgi:hypothetical protein
LNSVPVISGGVFDVFTDSPDVPNVPPVAVNDTVATVKGTPIAIAVTQNDDNPDFGFLDLSTVTATSGPVNGAVAVDPTTGVVTYSPNAGFLGTDSFRYTVRDDKGAISNEATVTIAVQRAPVGPSANNQAVIDDENTTKAVTLTSTGPNGDPLAFIVTANPANGTLSGTAPNLTYTPNPSFTGIDSFKFNVTDTTTGLVSNTATISVTIIPPGNIAPAPVTVSGITANKVYDGTTKVTLNLSHAQLGGVLPGDTVTLNTSGAVGTFASKDVANNIEVVVTGLSLVDARADGAGGFGNPGYFNSFNWTASGDPKDVHDTSYRGLTQVDHVTFDIETVTDILAKSVHIISTSDNHLIAQFAPQGSQGAVALKDLANALGVDHFNWRQNVLGISGFTRMKTFINANTPNKLSDVINDKIEVDPKNWTVE